jgi:hypothetical protein
MANAANDRFEAYYAEKLWEMIPAFYRDEDGLAANPGVLRSIVEIVAARAADLRRSNDRLWDDEFVDLCDSWAIPYIADLVGTRLVSSLNLRGQRVDVAKTIYYRRRKGTLRVLEELISDITGWDGKVVEEMRRLARAVHGLDPPAARAAGRFTGTPAGGLADLRRPRGAELNGTPFDEYSHFAEMRRARGTDGRYAIPKIGFHLYRLQSRQLFGVMPKQRVSGMEFTIDPSGRDLQLFMLRHRPEDFDWDTWRSASEWELPAPMRCRVLGHAEYMVTEAIVLDMVAHAGLSPAAAADLRKLRDIRFADEARLATALGALPNHTALLASTVYQALLRQALIEDCGKSALLPQPLPPGSAERKPLRVKTAADPLGVAREVIAAGNLATWTAVAANKQLVIDPERGRLLFLGTAPAAVTVDYCYGFSGDIGAGGYSRSKSLLPVTPNASLISPGSGAIPAAQINLGTALSPGLTQIQDSATYTPDPLVSGIQNATIQAKDLARPYVLLKADWTIDSGTSQNAALTIDGLWLGAAGAFSLVLKGDYETVTIRHSTLDPGGIDSQGNAINPLRLQIAGNIRNLIIDKSITGPIGLQGTGTGLVEKITVQDSILQSLAPAALQSINPATLQLFDPAAGAINLPQSSADIFRATIFGAVTLERLNASEALITRPAVVTDTQHGCFRFGAASTGSRIPHPYESHFIRDVGHYFTSRRFGDPGYAQLSASAPQSLLTGAENGSEIGAFSSLFNPIRFDGLRAKVDEYLPFGLIPLFIFET